MTPGLGHRASLVFALVLLLAASTVLGTSLRESSTASVATFASLQQTIAPYCDDGPYGKAVSCEVITDPELIMEMASIIDNTLATCGGVWEDIADDLKYEFLYGFKMMKFEQAGSDGGYWIAHPDGSFTIGITEDVFDGASVTNEFIFREIVGHEGLHHYLLDGGHDHSIWQTNSCLAH